MPWSARLPALRALGLAACALLGCGSAPPDANLLLITLDTTRADRLGCYGYARDTSPELDRLAREAVVYTRARSTTSWTLPAHASPLTGKFTASHGVRMDPRGELELGDALAGGGPLDAYRANGLAPGERTLAVILGEHGFTTAAVVAGPWLKRPFGLDRGFAHYDDRGITDVAGRRAADVSDAALAWLAAHGDERFFLFLNYYDPHAPYRDPEDQALRFLPPGTELPGPGGRANRQMLDALYDGEIRYMDAQIGRVLDGLRERGLFERSWIIVTADHGELLGEHGRTGHGRTLYEPELRIPLLVKPPAAAARAGRDDSPVQLTDVFSMVLEAFGIERPPGTAPPGAGPVLAEVYPLAQHGSDGDWVVLVDGDLKLHWNSRGAHLLFDLAADPAEARSLARLEPERLRAMQERLTARMAQLPPPPPRDGGQPVDAETRRVLRELGYVQ